MKHNFLVTPSTVQQEFDPEAQSSGIGNSLSSRRSFMKKAGIASIATIVAGNAAKAATIIVGGSIVTTTGGSYSHSWDDGTLTYSYSTASTSIKYKCKKCGDIEWVPGVSIDPPSTNGCPVP